MAPKRKKCAAGTESAPLPARELDFRTPGDDAWYRVRLVLEKKDGALRVMYCEFPETYDERYYYYYHHHHNHRSSSSSSAAAAAGPKNNYRGILGTLKEAEELRARFRPLSVQLQDSQCRQLKVGTTVCAAHAFGDCDVRFYDAAVDSVFFSTHKFDRGEDVCTCKFAVKWLHGPLSGEKTTLSIGDICLVQPLIVQDPVLDEFLGKVRKSFEVGSNTADQTDGHLPRTPKQDVESITEKLGPSSSRLPDELPGLADGCTLKSSLDSLNNYEDGGLSKRTIVLGNNSTGKVFSRQVFKQNDDFKVRLASQNGHKESYFSFWIENLENDLSPSIVMEFINKEAHVPSQVILYPGLLSYSSCKGSIFVRTKELAERLFDFLFNPAYMIVSTKGRPWVTRKKWCGEIEGIMPRYEDQMIKLVMSKITLVMHKINFKKNSSDSITKITCNKEMSKFKKLQQFIETKESSSEIRLVHIGTEEYGQAKRVHDLHKQFHVHVGGLQKKLASEEKALQKLQMEK